jgi:hypothetical protein
MGERAHVSSLEVLESFRAALIVYLSKARPALEEAVAGVGRVRGWIEDEQRTRWENQMRVRSRALDEAQQALFSARIGNLRHDTMAEQMVVQKAKRAVQEAEDKLRTIKRWVRDFDGRTQPLVKQIEKLQTVLTNDMVKATAFLNQAVDTLAAYAEVQAPAAPPSAGPAGGKEGAAS